MPPFDHAEITFEFETPIIVAERHNEEGGGHHYEDVLGNDEQNVEIEFLLGSEEAEGTATMNLTAYKASNSETGRTYHVSCHIEWNKDELTVLRDYLTFLIAHC